VSDPQPIFRRLLDERGGPDAFDVCQTAAARQLAQILAGDGGNVSAISALAAMLPPVVRRHEVNKVEVTFCSEPKWDLSKLDDAQLQTLAELAVIGTGTESPPRSRRLDYALSLARRLDAAESNGEIVLDERDRTEVQNDLMMMLSPLGPRQLFGITHIETELSQVRVELEQARKGLEETGGAPNASRGAPRNLRRSEQCSAV
jgi:hypothetical protein